MDESDSESSRYCHSLQLLDPFLFFGSQGDSSNIKSFILNAEGQKGKQACVRVNLQTHRLHNGEEAQPATAGFRFKVSLKMKSNCHEQRLEAH